MRGLTVDLIERLAQELELGIHWRGYSPFFALDDAVVLVRECQRRSFAVGLIEVFVARGESIMPRMDMIGHFDYGPTVAWEKQVLDSTKVTLNMLAEAKETAGDQLVFLSLVQEDKAITLDNQGEES
jgi:hypothetical protein